VDAGVQGAGVCGRSPGLSGSRGDTGPGSQGHGVRARNDFGVPGHWPTMLGSNAICKAEMLAEAQVREAGVGQRWADGDVPPASGGGASPRRSYAAAAQSGSPARSSATRGGQSSLRGDVPCDRAVAPPLRKETQGLQESSTRKRPASSSRGQTPPPCQGLGSCGPRHGGELAGSADGFQAPKRPRKAGSGGAGDLQALDDFNPYTVLNDWPFGDEAGAAGDLQDAEMALASGGCGTGDFLGRGAWIFTGGVSRCAVLCCPRCCRVG
jgi:hypothetical protein